MPFEPKESVIIHDIALLVHPRRHVNRVQFSFYVTSLPPTSLPTSTSTHVDLIAGPLFLHVFDCFDACDAPIDVVMEKSPA